jgi:hypothetical protein
VAAAAVLACGEVASAALLSFGTVIERARGLRSGWVAAIPIVIVNYVAFRAQLRFWQAHLGRSDAFLVSVALESIAIYLAWQAHRALVKDDSALRLRFGAYGMALIIGTLNYSHYMKPGWRPTVAAVTFGMMSAVSPWLWSIHSRRESRDDLKAQDLIEDHGVRLGFSRWFWYPRRSAQVQRLAAWAGENRPAAAIALYESRRESRRAGREAAQRAGQAPHKAAKAASQAESARPAAPAAKQPLPAPAREPRARLARAARTGLAAALNDTERNLIRELIQTGPELWPSQQVLADGHFGGSRTTARRVIKLARDEAAASGTAVNGGVNGVRANGS